MAGVTAKRFLLGPGAAAELSEAPLAWMKAVAILGIVAGVLLVFLFFDKRRVYRQRPDEKPEKLAPSSDKPSFDPVTMRMLLPDSLAGPRRYSLAALIAAVTVTALFPQDILFGTQHVPTPVSAIRTMDSLAIEQANTVDNDLVKNRSKKDPVPASERLLLMIVDGNRDGQLVLFPHDEHISSLGDQDACGSCHHQKMPFDQNSSCSECHRDMYASTDIFSHSSHIEKLGGNDGCAACHVNSGQVKTRDTATACTECHASMVVKGSFVEPEENGLKGNAVGYKDAMHGLCVACHEELDPDLAECATCHRDKDAKQLRRLSPYVAGRLEERQPWKR